MMTHELTAEKIVCLEVLAVVATLKGDPTPKAFEAFLVALSTFQPLPPEITPERLLSHPPALETRLPQIQTPALQQQVYRGACMITRTQGPKPQEAALLARLREAFQLSPEMAQALAKQPLIAPLSEQLMNSALTGMTALIGREGDMRRLIFDYALGTAIVGLVPITGGGSLELKLLVVLGLILKMIWDIRNLWGNPKGQDLLAMIGNGFGFLGAVLSGLLAWATVVGLGVVVPYLGAFDKAAGFATATWIVGQSTHQFCTSQKRPDFVALKRIFPTLIDANHPPLSSLKNQDHEQS
ncbi:hypothetical protein [Lyngbya confervoides]|uniref:Uncharacterized protein n=1 Tax=Lyngbya confervoides BDU141951 TaxID=1574623 RepID=A0ABD4T851_9CYAN|nr:hypothetical protein [Lyngbya confervoides]MCM1984969.1 hypothetical protein [Lyngbya confervoides BDU141951]